MVLEIAPRLLEAEIDARGEARQQAVRETGDRVLLLEHDRSAEHGGGEHRRRARVAARAEHDVRPEPGDDPERLEESGAGARGAPQAPRRPPPPHALRGDVRYRIARLGDQFRFEPRSGSDEEGVEVRNHGPELVGDGKRRKDVAARSARCKQHPRAHPTRLPPWTTGAARTTRAAGAEARRFPRGGPVPFPRTTR